MPCILWSVKAQSVSVTFQVDMTVQIAKAAYKPGDQKVWTIGFFPDFRQVEMSDTDGDSVYTVTISGIAQNTTIDYKFHA